MPGAKALDFSLGFKAFPIADTQIIQNLLLLRIPGTGTKRSLPAGAQDFSFNLLSPGPNSFFQLCFFYGAHATTLYQRCSPARATV